MYRPKIAALPEITAGNFEHYLNSDETLVDFFNDFLSLPCFPVAVFFSRAAGHFEAVSPGERCLRRKISAVLHHGRAQLLSDDPATLAHAAPLPDNHYTARCLDKEQGMQWIMNARFPLFVQSDCYTEYRLAKMLSQWRPYPDEQSTDYQSVKCNTKPPGNQTDTVTGNDRPSAPTASLEEGGDPDRPLEHLAAAAVVKQVIRAAVEVMEGCIQKKLGVKQEEDSDGAKKKNVLNVRYHGAGFYDSRRTLDQFKESLRGTQGEKLLHLWMDIERLKTTQHPERKNRHLSQMRSRYMRSCSPSSLSAELFSRLGLATSPCWTEDKLHRVQPCLTEALLFYWAPRLWWNQTAGTESTNLGALQTDSTTVEEEPYCRCAARLTPHRPDTGPPSSPPETPSFSSISSPALCGSGMDSMFKALFLNSRAGLYFTRFCERSGNQLWESAIHFWTDLQDYHQLFYQDSLDPYTIQRQAQFLYSTYLCCSAQSSVGLDEGQRSGVYERLWPAFEELFDQVEEHALTVLLEPWALLVDRDALSYQRVCVSEEERCVDSAEYRELQSLHMQSELRLKELQQGRPALLTSPRSPLLPEGLVRQPDPWSEVPERYRGYRLGSLLRSRPEIQHFLSFLEEHDASVHLSCWLDLERYRRTPQRDVTVQEARSSDISDKYLNSKYFFGPGSPALAEQQKKVLCLAGGEERLRGERLSNAVVAEVQSVIRSHIERTWLPRFLATAEFAERQHYKPQAAAGSSEQGHRRQPKRRGAWKQAEGLWMSSSKEILTFRRVLLNPVTCLPLQRFAALQGGFLENDVLFWLEVQRYKELCHSHVDEATIQKKISIIINCFINSSLHPAVQIDVPPEQAQNILEKRHELGPYIFREAQMSVFSELLKLWPQFQALRSSMAEEQLLPLLEEQGVKHRARMQRRRRKEEERRRREQELERQECSWFEEEEEEGLDGEKEERRSGECSRRAPCSPSQQITWCYSKYVTALKQEEASLRRRQRPLEADDSFSTASDSSASLSVKSAARGCSLKQTSGLSSRTERV